MPEDAGFPVRGPEGRSLQEVFWSTATTKSSRVQLFLALNSATPGQIAEYLHVPAEISPQVGSDDGYARHKADWKGRTASCRPRRLPSDQGGMAGFLVRDLVRSASYKMAVARLRGCGDMTDQAHLVADYFVDVDVHAEIGDLTTAATLLTYAFGDARWDGSVWTSPVCMTIGTNWRARLIAADSMAQRENSKVEAELAIAGAMFRARR